MTIHVCTAKGDVHPPINIPEYVKPNAAVELKDIARAIASARRIVVVAGAGISVASGIPDFRSSEGLFRTLKEDNPRELLLSGKDLFDSSVFNVPEQAALFYKMIGQLASLSATASPSPFHYLLKLLDQRGQLLRLYTQNIDDLEAKAGLTSGVPTWPSKTPALNSPATEANSYLPPRCVPLHGTLKELVCQRCSHSIPLETKIHILARGHSVACPQCTSNGSVRRMEGKRDRGIGRMRPSVVLYGEEHRSGEGVGECVRRDLIGLGDVSSNASLPTLDPSSSKGSKVSPTKGTAPRARAAAKPDLLIVAGSSLKVPGTKRIVREFAKAVQATRGGAPSTSSSSRASSPTHGFISTGKKSSRTAQLQASAGSGSISKSSRLRDQVTAENDRGSERTVLDSGSDGDDTAASSEDVMANVSPRTIYLNLDFPVPTRDWKDVFDVWVQGDLQEFVDVFVSALKEKDLYDSVGIVSPPSKKAGGQKRKATSSSYTEENEKKPKRQRKVQYGTDEYGSTVTIKGKPERNGSLRKGYRTLSNPIITPIPSLSSATTRKRVQSETRRRASPTTDDANADSPEMLAAAQSLIDLSISTPPQSHCWDFPVSSTIPQTPTSSSMTYSSHTTADVCLRTPVRRSSIVQHKRTSSQVPEIVIKSRPANEQRIVLPSLADTFPDLLSPFSYHHPFLGISKPRMRT